MEGAKIMACVLVVLVAAASQTAADYDRRESRMVERARIERMHPESADGCVEGDCLLQNSESPVGAMWFGPRLGRRRRSEGRLNAWAIVKALRDGSLAKQRWLDDRLEELRLPRRELLRLRVNGQL